MRAQASDEGRVYQAGRDQYVTENHFHFAAPGTGPADDPPGGGGTDRRGFIQRVGGLAGVLMTDGVSRSGSQVRVDPGLIGSLAMLRRNLVTSERSMGPAQVLPLARQQISVLSLMRRDTSDRALGRDILKLQATWMDFLGWLWQSSGDFETAGTYAEKSATLAMAAGDQVLAGYFHARRSQMATDDFDAHVGLGLAEQSVGGDRPPSRMRAFGHQQCAHAWALLGDERRALAALDTAQHMIHEPEAPRDPLGVSAGFMTDNYLRAQRAVILLRVGRLAQATDEMRSSLDAWDTGFNHEMGLHQANLAHAYALAGDTTTSFEYAEAALRNALETGSGRTLHVLAAVVRELYDKVRWSAEFESFARRVEFALRPPGTMDG
ncbi:hypothetical protein ABZ916_08970 [Streptomyces sp. NPDC046853]|uniref:hypothetical protein n=1 Tax=Streptomyces sp. NPDC046853 TaxID=3154920 RepID=UPI0033E5E4C3